MTECVLFRPHRPKPKAGYFEKQFLPFVGLPDPKASVLTLYGKEVNLLKLGEMPAQLLIDQEVSHVVPIAEAITTRLVSLELIQFFSACSFRSNQPSVLDQAIASKKVVWKHKVNLQ
jgi:hypothetical protein